VAIDKDLKEKAQLTREDGAFTLKLDEGISLALLRALQRTCFRASVRKIPVCGRQTMENWWSQSAVAHQWRRIE
jgi:hypothetical protein